MKLSEITPMILTYNEEPNLQATLEGVAWASRILVVDSFSTDATLEIASTFPQVRVVQRPFDHFAAQCNFALTHIETPWVLSLDADYKCSPAFADELAELIPSKPGYRASFRYGIYGYPLRATLYPPRTVLYRRDSARYAPDGHAHRVMITGNLGELRCPILHDDWKSISAWLQSQSFYAKMEADKILSRPAQELSWKDRLRKQVLIAPWLTFFYCLFAKRLLLDGWRGIFYALQRSYAELVLSLVLLDRNLRARSVHSSAVSKTKIDQSLAR